MYPSSSQGSVVYRPTVVAPLVIGLLWRNVPKASGVVAMAAGAVVAAVWEWGLANPWGVPSLVAGLVANQLAFWIVVYQSRRGEAR